MIASSLSFPFAPLTVAADASLVAPNKATDFANAFGGLLVASTPSTGGDRPPSIAVFPSGLTMGAVVALQPDLVGPTLAPVVPSRDEPASEEPTAGFAGPVDGTVSAAPWTPPVDVVWTDDPARHAAAGFLPAKPIPVDREPCPTIPPNQAIDRPIDNAAHAVGHPGVQAPIARSPASAPSPAMPEPGPTSPPPTGARIAAAPSGEVPRGEPNEVESVAADQPADRERRTGLDQAATGSPAVLSSATYPALPPDPALSTPVAPAQPAADDATDARVDRTTAAPAPLRADDAPMRSGAAPRFAQTLPFGGERAAGKPFRPSTAIKSIGGGDTARPVPTLPMPTMPVPIDGNTAGPPPSAPAIQAPADGNLAGSFGQVGGGDTAKPDPSSSAARDPVQGDLTGPRSSNHGSSPLAQSAGPPASPASQAVPPAIRRAIGSADSRGDLAIAPGRRAAAAIKSIGGGDTARPVPTLPMPTIPVLIDGNTAGPPPSAPAIQAPTDGDLAGSFGQVGGGDTAKPDPSSSAARDPVQGDLTGSRSSDHGSSPLAQSAGPPASPASQAVPPAIRRAIGSADSRGDLAIAPGRRAAAAMTDVPPTGARTEMPVADRGKTPSPAPVASDAAAPAPADTLTQLLSAPATAGERFALAPDARPASAAEASAVRVHSGRLGHETGVVIARYVLENGTGSMTVRLDPKEFGRVEVSLSFDDAGALRAVIAADNPASLDLLRRDAPELARALADAGLRADDYTLRFDSRGEGNGGGGQPWQRQQPCYSKAAPTEDSGDPAARPAWRPLATRGRIDLMA